MDVRAFEGRPMLGRVLTVLFISTGNSARSIFAESILNHEFGDNFIGFSAGTAPKANVAPAAISLLKAAGHDTSYLRPKNWREFAAPEALRFDFAVTVCDDVLYEKFPIWNGHPISSHWEIANPTTAGERADEQYEAYQRAFGMIHERIASFCELAPSSVRKPQFTASHNPNWLIQNSSAASQLSETV